MSEFNFELQAGNSIKLHTAGKYCNKDIIVSSPEVEPVIKGSKPIKIATDFECIRTATTIDLTSYDWWQSITLDDIFCVTKKIVATASGSLSKNAECSPEISYSNGILSLNRTGLSGSLVLSFIMDIYVCVPQ